MLGEFSRASKATEASSMVTSNGHPAELLYRGQPRQQAEEQSKRHVLRLQLPFTLTPVSRDPGCIYKQFQAVMIQIPEFRSYIRWLRTRYSHQRTQRQATFTAANTNKPLPCSISLGIADHLFQPLRACPQLAFSFPQRVTKSFELSHENL